MTLFVEKLVRILIVTILFNLIFILTKPEKSLDYACNLDNLRDDYLKHKQEKNDKEVFSLKQFFSFNNQNINFLSFK